MIPLALFLLPYAPRRLRPWLMGIAIGRKPEQMEWRDGKWRLPLDEAERDIGRSARLRFTGTDEEAQAILDEIDAQTAKASVPSDASKDSADR